VAFADKTASFLERQAPGGSSEDGTRVGRGWDDTDDGVSLVRLSSLVMVETNGTNKTSGYPPHFRLLI
jgi:hypothetical protein